MTNKKRIISNNLDEDIKKLVITRIQAEMPDNLRLCIGQEESGLSGTQMIEHIEKNDEIGRQIIESHLKFIRAQSSGQLLSALNSV